MGQEPERLRQWPTRHGVGREALVENTDGRLQIRITKILVEVGQICGHHQAFVGQCLVGKTADIEFRVFRHIPLGMTAPHKQADREFFLGLTARLYKHLFNARQTVQSHRPQAAVINRHFPPAHNLKPLICEPFFYSCSTCRSFCVVLSQKNLANCKQVARFFAEGCLGSFIEEGLGALNKQATTITGLAIGSNAAPVGHAGQRFNGCLQQLMARFALHVGNQAKTAVVPELIRMIQACCHKRSLACKCFPPATLLHQKSAKNTLTPKKRGKGFYTRETTYTIFFVVWDLKRTGMVQTSVILVGSNPRIRDPQRVGQTSRRRTCLFSARVLTINQHKPR